MGHLDPIAYTYDADWHCPGCAFERFGQDDNGFVPEDAVDSEGNEPGAVAPWDEWWSGDYGCETLVCSDCLGEIDEAHVDPHSEDCPDYEPPDDDEPSQDDGSLLYEVRQAELWGSAFGPVE